MSQLADLKYVVLRTSLPPFEKSQLFLDILEALEWDVDVKTIEDAQIFLGLTQAE
jgi:hypothetical protein